MNFLSARTGTRISIDHLTGINGLCPYVCHEWIPVLLVWLPCFIWLPYLYMVTLFFKLLSHFVMIGSLIVGMKKPSSRVET